MVPVPSERHRAELRTDLQVERTKLAVLVESLAALQRDWDVPVGSQERCDAAALRLQSLYTGIERCFVQIVRVLNGGPPNGADWHRRLLDSSTAKGLAELMRFRHVVRHLYAYELEPEQVQRLLRRALELWPVVDHQLVAFDSWLQALAE